MIKNAYGDDVVSLVKTDSYGGVDLAVTMQPLYREALRWLVLHKHEVEQEKKLREDNLAVKNAWEQYQVIKTLAQKETA